MDLGFFYLFFLLCLGGGSFLGVLLILEHLWVSGEVYIIRMALRSLLLLPCLLLAFLYAYVDGLISSRVHIITELD
jgi:hypothetical protein